MDHEDKPQAPVKSPQGRIITQKARDRMWESFEREQLPTDVKSTLQYSLNGDLRRWHLLVHSMIDTWPRLATNLEKVYKKVTRASWEIVPASVIDEEPTASATAHADAVQAGREFMTPNPAYNELGFKGMIERIIFGFYAGTSVQELLWARAEKNDNLILPRATKYIPARHYSYPSGSEEEDRLMLSLDPGPRIAQLEDFPENRFIVTVKQSHPGHPAVSAPFRVLCQYWLASIYGLKYSLEYANTFGLPFIYATVTEGTDKSQVESALENIVSGRMVLDEGAEINTIDVGATSGMPQKELIDLANQVCDIYMLGQTLTTEVGSSGGNRALGEVHKGEESDMMDGLLDYVGQALSDQFAKPIVWFNFGTDEEVPKFKAKVDRPKDEKGMAERDHILLADGVEMTKEFYHERHGIPIPKEGEELFEFKTPVPPVIGGGDDDEDDDTDDDTEDVNARHVEGHEDHNQKDHGNRGSRSSGVVDSTDIENLFHKQLNPVLSWELKHDPKNTLATKIALSRLAEEAESQGELTAHFIEEGLEYNDGYTRDDMANRFLNDDFSGVVSDVQDEIDLGGMSVEDAEFESSQPLSEWLIAGRGEGGINTSGYILPDGRMVSMTHDGRSRDMDHREINFPGSPGGTEGMVAIMNSGTVRMDARSGAVGLRVPPTPAQSRVIRKIAANTTVFLDAEIAGDDGWSEERTASFKADEFEIDDTLDSVRAFFRGRVQPKGEITRGKHIQAANQEDKLDEISDKVLGDLAVVSTEWLGRFKPEMDRLAVMAMSGKVTDQDFIATLRKFDQELPEAFKDDLNTETMVDAFVAAGVPMLAGAQAEERKMREAPVEAKTVQGHEDHNQLDHGRRGGQTNLKRPATKEELAALTEEERNEIYTTESDTDTERAHAKASALFLKERKLVETREDGSLKNLLSFSAKDKKKIQYTAFDGDGQPWSDAEYPLSREGLKEAIDDNGIWIRFLRPDIPDTAGIGVGSEQFVHSYTLRLRPASLGTHPRPKLANIVAERIVEYPTILTQEELDDFEMNGLSVRLVEGSPVEGKRRTIMEIEKEKGWEPLPDHIQKQTVASAIPSVRSDKPKKKRTRKYTARARYPKGHEKAGQFMPKA